MATNWRVLRLDYSPCARLLEIVIRSSLLVSSSFLVRSWLEQERSDEPDSFLRIRWLTASHDPEVES